MFLSLWRAALVAAAVAMCGMLSAADREAPLEIARGAKARAAKAISLAEAKGPERVSMLGKTITVAGYYVNDGAPMLVSNPDLMLANIALPTDSYIVLQGTPPSSLKPGAKVTLTGNLQQPGGRDATTLQDEGSLLRISAASRVTTQVPASRVRAPVSMATMAKAHRRPVGRAAARPDLPEADRRYALILNGGMPASSPGWRVRYWNETCMMNNRLVAEGVPASHIYLLSGAGTGLRDLPWDRPATRRGLREAIGELAERMNENSRLFVFVTGPGGGFLKETWRSGDHVTRAGLYDGAVDEDRDEVGDDYVEVRYRQNINRDGDMLDIVSIDETIVLGSELITDDWFAEQINRITECESMVFLMNQSFAGGFCEELKGPGRVVFAACGEEEFSLARTGEHLSELPLWWLVGLGERVPGHARRRFPWHYSFHVFNGAFASNRTSSTFRHECDETAPYQSSPVTSAEAQAYPALFTRW